MSNVYDRMIDVLHSRGWTKGAMQRRTGEVCTMGALKIAITGRAHGDVPYKKSAEYERTVRFLTREISKEARIYGVPQWNDAPSRTMDDVLHLLKKLSEDYELAKEKRQ